VNISEFSPEEIATLIARMLNERDPATVGLRRIVRRKTVEADDFPMRNLAAEEFVSPGKGKTLLTEDERRIIELERQLKDLKETIARQNLNARQAVAKAYAQGHEKGEEKGFDEGKTQAVEEYQKQLSAVQERIASYLKNFEEEKRGIYANADRILLELCGRMVKKIINTETGRNPDIVLNVLKKSLSYIAERERIVIRVAPDDMENVSGSREFWAPVTDRLKEVVIEPDPRVEKGGCIIESNSGIVDARLGVQMSELAGLVEKAWESSHAGQIPKIDTPEAHDS
jgi:flagellar assembly protein FliH